MDIICRTIPSFCLKFLYFFRREYLSECICYLQRVFMTWLMQQAEILDLSLKNVQYPSFLNLREPFLSHPPKLCNPLFFLLCFLISILMIKRYLGKRSLVPTWKLVMSFISPWAELGAYVNSTRKEYGHVGIWLKLMVGSFVVMILTGIMLAIL